MTAIGREQSIEDVMDPARAAGLAALLGVAELGTDLPPFFHQAYFWEMPSPEQLGRDGHPARGAFLPDLGLPRRMWAGGRLRFLGPLRPGIPARKTTRITHVEEKSGRTGKLAFVTLRHEIEQSGALAITEEQDLVFREEHAPDAPEARVTPAPDDVAPVPRTFDAAFLFRYSALTYNGHRIHYDAAYAQQIEGYGGVVVHGPLLAQLMMLRASARGRLQAFNFRAVRPLLLSETATICEDGDKLWVRTPSGALNMTAEAILQ